MSDICELVLDGPGKNALGTPMIESILGRLDAAEGKAVLLSGSGDAFSAGLDLKEIAALDAPGMTRFITLVERLFERVFDWPQPVVAAINGHAIAGGCILALCCDHRVATDDARMRMGLNEVALGLVFPPKIARICMHRVPPRARHEVMLRAALYAPVDALRLGLVDELSSDPLAVARDRMREMAAHPRAAYVAAKRTLRAGVTRFEPADYEAALRTTLATWTGDDIKRALVARTTKR